MSTDTLPHDNLSRWLKAESEQIEKHIKTTLDGIENAEEKIGGRWEFRNLSEQLAAVKEVIKRLQENEKGLHTILKQISTIESNIAEDAFKLDMGRMERLLSALQETIKRLAQQILTIDAGLEQDANILVQFKGIANQYIAHLESYIYLANNLLGKESEIEHYFNNMLARLDKLIEEQKERPAEDHLGEVEQTALKIEGKTEQLIKFVDEVDERIKKGTFSPDVEDEFQRIKQYVSLAIVRIEQFEAVVRYAEDDVRVKGYADKPEIKKIIKSLEEYKERIKLTFRELRKTTIAVRDELDRFRRPLINVAVVRDNVSRDLAKIIEDHATFTERLKTQIYEKMLAITDTVETLSDGSAGNKATAVHDRLKAASENIESMLNRELTPEIRHLRQLARNTP